MWVNEGGGRCTCGKMRVRRVYVWVKMGRRVYVRVNEGEEGVRVGE